MVLCGSSSLSDMDMVSRCVVKMEISLTYYTFGKVNEDLTPAQSHKHVPSHNIYICYVHTKTKAWHSSKSHKYHFVSYLFL